MSATGQQDINSPARTRIDRSAVRVLVLLPNPYIRGFVRDCLRKFGVETIEQTHSVEAARQLLGERNFDLIIMSDVTADVVTAPIVHQVRQGLLGRHVFPLFMIMVSSAPDSQEVETLLEAGPDDLILLPCEQAELSRRIQRLLSERQPFVFTDHYVGPERRGHLRKGRENGAPQSVAVPHPVLLRQEKIGDAEIERFLSDESRRHYQRRERTALLLLKQMLAGASRLCIAEPLDVGAIEAMVKRLIATGQNLAMVQNAHGDPRVKDLFEAFLSGIAELDGVKLSNKSRVFALAQLFQQAHSELTPLL